MCFSRGEKNIKRRTYVYMNNEPFVLLSSATKGKFTQLLGTTKLKSPIARGTCKKKRERKKKQQNVTHWFQGEKRMAGA